MKHITPIIHLTNACNLGCKYCYTGSAFFSQSTRNRVNEEFTDSLSNLFLFFDKLANYNEFELTKCIFHGGEPLLISIENWRKMFDYIKSKGFPITPSVQTNATLINDEFIELFKEFGFEVGVSLDGNKEINDQTRPLKNGSSSFPIVYENILKLKESGIKFGVLVTLNKYNKDQIDVLYDFFKDHKIPFSIRPIFQSQYSEDNNFQLEPEEYGKAFCKLFDLWFDDETIDVSFISEFSSLIIQFTNPIEGLVSCNFNMKCSEHFVSVDLNGEISPCNRFYGVREFVYGNINNSSLDDLLNNEVAKPLRERWNKLNETECQSCEIKEYCYGGCPANSFALKNDYYSKDFYCAAYKKIYYHINTKIRNVLKDSQ
jgi:uncharacterized protein